MTFNQNSDDSNSENSSCWKNNYKGQKSSKTNEYINEIKNRYLGLINTYKSFYFLKSYIFNFRYG